MRGGPEKARGGRRAIALATDGGTPGPTPDDAAAMALLAERCDATVEAVEWDAPGEAWRDYDAILVRSTWNYHLRLDAFLEWAERVEAAGTALWNPASVLRWNADKGYLAALERAGVPIVPTEWIPRAADGDLASILARTGWSRAVVKPSVSATAFRTAVADPERAESHPALLSAVLEQGDALVQPLLQEVTGSGEWSFIYFAGADGALEFSHAVVKRPAAGDFRVQPQFGGTTRPERAPGSLLSQATEVAGIVSRTAPGPLLYARIDGVVSEGDHAPAGTFLLMEAELIEPMLFLTLDDHAPGRFASAVARRIRGNGRGAS